jgi:hypothetical protein
MPAFNNDVLFLIFEKLHDCKALFSCLMVNRIWCKTVIPILWKNSWKYNINYGDKPQLFYIITCHLNDSIKEIITNQILPPISPKLFYLIIYPFVEV